VAPGIGLIGLPDRSAVKCSTRARLVAGITLDQIEVVPLHRNI
jgi:hypothetical protein